MTIYIANQSILPPPPNASLTWMRQHFFLVVTIDMKRCNNWIQLEAQKKRRLRSEFFVMYPCSTPSSRPITINFYCINFFFPSSLLGLGDKKGPEDKVLKTTGPAQSSTHIRTSSLVLKALDGGRKHAGLVSASARALLRIMMACKHGTECKQCRPTFHTTFYFVDRFFSFPWEK